MKKNPWRVKAEKTQAELERYKREVDEQKYLLNEFAKKARADTATIAGLCDCIRATAEQLEYRGIAVDTARHIRTIANNYDSRSVVKADAAERR